MATGEADRLVVGSGFAGLWAAIAAREAGVERVARVDQAAIALSSQSKLSAGATIYGLAEDDARAWLGAFAEAQSWLCRQDMVENLLATSAARLRRLESWSVRYQPGPLARATCASRRGACTAARCWCCRAGAAGWAARPWSRRCDARRCDSA